MTILHSQCLPTELVKTANAVAINSVAGPVTGVVAPTSAPATGSSVWYVDTSTSPDTLYFWNGTVWSAVGDGSSLVTQDEGVALGATTTMNFVGSGVAATYAAGVATVTIPGATSLAFQDEGVALSSTSTVNFAGAGVVATNTAGVTTVTIPGGAGTFATNAEAQAGTSTALMVNPANLYSRENIAAQTGVSNTLTAIPVPSAGQSNWAVNLLGETLHYAPNVGWKLAGPGYTTGVLNMTPQTLTAGAIVTLATATMPRAGRIIVTNRVDAFHVVGLVLMAFINSTYEGTRSSALSGINPISSLTIALDVTAGQVIAFEAYATPVGSTTVRHRWDYHYIA